MKLAVVIPTRHHPELAIAVIETLLAQPDAGLSVVVSDNSTDGRDVQRLRQLRRIRRPAPSLRAAARGSGHGGALGLGARPGNGTHRRALERKVQTSYPASLTSFDVRSALSFVKNSERMEE
jgi:glycosyltransferase involved in cell wall biosynthesis